MRFACVATLLAGCIAAQGAWAGEEASAPNAPPPGPKLTPLTYDWTVDGIVTGVLGGSTITLLLLDKDLAPLSCKWCVPGTIDGNLSKSVTWSNPHTAATISDVMEFVVPIGVIGFGLIQAYRLDDAEAGWSDALLIAEATSLAMLGNTIVKYTVGRSRPYVWQGNPDLYPNATDANVSFFGGHATFVFAAVVSASTLFFMQGMPGAPYVLGAGLAVATFTAYLRMAADKHYLSDVLVGAGVGSLVGWAVPYLFHRPGRKGPPQAGDVAPAPGGVAVAW